MTPYVEQRHDEPLHELVHDVKDSLNVVGLGMEVLRDLREDEVRFAEVRLSIDRERLRALGLLDRFLEATCEGCGRPIVALVPPAAPDNTAYLV